VKKLLLLFIIPFLSFGQDCDLEDLTYVPDDSFENYIETNFPDANNGVENDNYVLTSGLHGGPYWIAFTPPTIELSPTTLEAPIFDLTGIEAFHSNISSISISNQPVLNINLSCLNIINDLIQYPKHPVISIEGCPLLEEIVLPSDTIGGLNIGNPTQNSSLSNIVFPDELTFEAHGFVEITETGCITTGMTILADNLCLDINGEALCPIQVSIVGFPGGNNSIDLSDLTIVYESSLNLGSYQSPSQVNLVGPNTFYWTNVSIDGNFNCLQVDNPSYCNLSEYWENSTETDYVSSCYDDCEFITNILETNSNKSPFKKIDLLGRETTNKGFQLHIYDDGSVEKKYLIK
jgi:hypothetical protein